MSPLAITILPAIRIPCAKRITLHRWTARLTFIIAAVATSVSGAAVPTGSPVDKINAAAARAQITAQQVRGEITVVMGSGGNITVLSSPAGKLLVDAGITVSRPALEPAFNRISTHPIKYVINTHWHFDHADGNEWIHDLGATIIGHENTLEHLSNTMLIADWDHTFEPVPPGARPTVIVRTHDNLKFGGETIAVKYYGFAAHTDGDLYVYFPKADVLSTGDTWWNGFYPFIDYVAGGNIDGMIRAADANIALVTEQTLIVPGHGPVGDRRQMIEYRDMLVAVRKKVAELKSAGKSLDEVVAAKPTAAYDAKWGNFVIDPDFFTRLVYRGV
jgi:glyoxylase-like metal-dependent hydrolase (beta-lactamase superfamily II)